MKTKKTQVVMLRTRTNSVLSKAYLANPSYLRFQESSFKDDSYSINDNQHLYFLSDDEIKEGEWCFNSYTNEIWQVKTMLTFVDRKYNKKIIASTDESLGLPRPSNSFIQKYVEEYNKGNIITEVMVEYELYNTKPNSIPIYGKFDYKVKTKPDNTIIISVVEETWVDIVHKFTESGRLRSTQAFIEWLKENNYQVPKQIKEGEK